MEPKILQKDFHSLDVVEAMRLLETSIYGLANDEAKLRKKQIGANVLPEGKKSSKLIMFFSQFNSLLVYLLLGAAALSFYFNHLVDAVVILIVTLINAIFGFVQEYRSEKAIAALKKLVKDTIRVIRGGQQMEIEVAELVPGDIMLVGEGDKLPADGRVIEAKNLLVNEASLTGESMPQRKIIEVVKLKTPLQERENMIYSGTVVVAGEGKIVISSTGVYTELGKIATQVQSSNRGKSHFMNKVDNLGKQLAVIAIVGALLVVLIGWLNGFTWFDLFLFGIASAVSGIPEGLPVVLVVVLAIGVQRMAKRRAIVKHLASVEPLGMVDVICTDKTGTLTKNVMTVTNIFYGGKTVSVDGTGYKLKGDFWQDKNKMVPLTDPWLSQMLTAGSIVHHSSLVIKSDDATKDEAAEVVGDPTEVALMIAAYKAGLSKEQLLIDNKVVDNLPFSSEYKFQAALVSSKQVNDSEEKKLYVIGALETLLPRCKKVLWHGEEKKISEELVNDYEKNHKKLAQEGYRIITMAYRAADAKQTEINHDNVNSLTLLGLFAIIDPPREEVKSAIDLCQRAGIRVVMITGDNIDTAMAIGRQIGLLDKKANRGQVYTDMDIVDYTDKQFSELAKEVKILARVSPTTKMRLVKELQASGHTVAMTGDGVNDAPALKQADIGVAMGKAGTDVAREAAEIVLADDNFASLINAVEEGRAVFNNVRRTSAFLVTTNVAEFLTLIVMLLLGTGMPLLPIQILWLNLVTDGFAGISLATEKTHGDVLHRPPFARDTKILNKEVFDLIVIVGVLMVMCAVVIGYPLLKAGLYEYGRSLIFASMSLLQLWNVYNLRSMNKSIWRVGWFKNNYISLGILASLVLMLVVMYVPFLQNIFSFVPLTLKDWLMIVPLTFSVIVGVEIYKYFKFYDKRLFRKS